MHVAVVVLAAGEGRRMGGPKALLPIQGTTFLAHLCGVFARAGLDLVVAVLGAEAERVRQEASIPDGVTVVVNEDWRSGMLSSMCRGLDAAETLGAEAVLVHPVDHPVVEPSTIAAVGSALLGGAAIAVPTCAGRRGHPAGFAASMFDAIRQAPPEVGARAVLAANAGRIVHVPGGPGCLVGVDMREDLERLPGLPTPAAGS